MGVGLGLGLGLGLGSGLGLGVGLGLGLGSGFGLGAGLGLRLGLELRLGLGLGSGFGLGVGVGLGLGSGFGLGVGLGLGLELRLGLGSGFGLGVGVGLEFGLGFGLGLGLGAGPGLGGICASAGARQVPKKEQISTLDRIVSNKDCIFPVLCIAGDPGSLPPVVIPSPGAKTSLCGPDKDKSVLSVDLGLGECLPLTTSVILPLPLIPFMDLPLAWASAIGITPPATNTDPHSIIATKSVLLLLKCRCIDRLAKNKFPSAWLAADKEGNKGGFLAH